MFLEHASAQLTRFCPIPLHLTWHRNSTSYFFYRRKGGVLFLRLHRLFAQAQDPVLEAVIGYAIKRDLKAKAIVRQAACSYFSQQRSNPKPLQTKGRVYDLELIREKIKKCYFPHLDVAIGWSSYYRSGQFRCITFGSYDSHCNQVRINPILDDPLVPLYFLEFIVYHEMLHAVIPPSLDSRGAIRIHSSVFRLLERKFSQFQAAKEWKKQSLQFFKKRKSDGRT